jgi:hypothetical protein
MFFGETFRGILGKSHLGKRRLGKRHLGKHCLGKCHLGKRCLGRHRFIVWGNGVGGIALVPKKHNIGPMNESLKKYNSTNM